jgi:hypothetical protein
VLEKFVLKPQKSALLKSQRNLLAELRREISSMIALSPSKSLLFIPMFTLRSIGGQRNKQTVAQ